MTVGILSVGFTVGYFEKQLNGSTIKDRSDDPSHREQTSITELRIFLSHIKTPVISMVLLTTVLNFDPVVLNVEL